MTDNRNYEFQKLTPTEDVDNLKTYEEALDFALNNMEIKNIAITGMYGSGKSSVLESYKKKKLSNNEIGSTDFLHISLTNFKSVRDSPYENNREDLQTNTAKKNNENSEKLQEESDSISDRENIDNKTLEGKILNQLLHQINPKNIPQTIFKLKRKVSFVEVAVYSVFIILLILNIMYLWESSGEDIFRIIAILFFIFQIVVLIYQTVNLQLNRKILKNFSIRGANFQSDIEVFKDSKESYFDKYLDDVIYLFNNSGAKVIVFEDIDRFDNNVIFAKLKEINTLVNNRKGKDGKITFLYMLKDDMFLSKDRTKFFDFIIPIIPIINSTNSYDKLKELLEKQIIKTNYDNKSNIGLEADNKGDNIEETNNRASSNWCEKLKRIIIKKTKINSDNKSKARLEVDNEDNNPTTNDKTLFDLFDNNFLLKLSLYIDDMRLLKNIINEFIIYYERIDNLKLNINNFFAIIVYKNIFPNDFSEFQLNRGFIYQLFSSKNELIIEEKDKFNSQIRELKEKIKNNEREMLKSKFELYALFFNGKEEYSNIEVNGKRQNGFKNRTEFVKAIIDANYKVRAKRLNQPYSYNNIDLTKEFTTIKENPEFVKRLENINNKNKIDNFQEEIKGLETKIRQLSEAKLSTIITRKNIEKIQKEPFIGEIEEFEDIKKNHYFNLLVFLITAGYIDEDYSSYITYFYENSLTVEDQEFLRGVFAERNFEYEYKLTNLSEIYNRLGRKDYWKKGTLNFDLFRYILKNNDLLGQNTILESYLKQINQSNNTNFFITFYLQENVEVRSEVLLQLNKYSPNLLKRVIQDEAIVEDDKNKLIIEGFSLYTKEDLLKFKDDQKIIVDFIENSGSLLCQYKYNKQFMKNLESWDIKFGKVNFKEIDTDLGDFIYERNLYVIKESNLSSILSFYYDINNSHRIKHKNYTSILNTGESSIKKYVEENIEIYLKEYLSFSEGIVEDDVKDIYFILNNDSLDTEDKNSYIEAFEGQKLLLEKLETQEFYKQLINQDNLIVNAQNILTYFKYSENKWTEELIEFVNKNKDNLNFKWPIENKNFDNDLKISFFVATIKEYNLENDAYKNILENVKRYYKKDFPFHDVPDDKMKIIIDLEIIHFSEENLIALRSNYPENVSYFASKNLKLYLELVKDKTLYNYKELLDTLDRHLESSINIQRDIVDTIKEPVSVIDQSYGTNLVNYILKYKFNMNDLSYLIQEYERFPNSTKDIILEIATERIDNIINQNIGLPKSLLKKLLPLSSINIEQRRLLFSRNIGEVKRNELKKLFELLDFNQYVSVINENRRNIDFEVNEINQNILENLKERKLVARYKEEGNNYWVNSKQELNLI